MKYFPILTALIVVVALMLVGCGSFEPPTQELDQSLYLVPVKQFQF